MKLQGRVGVGLKRRQVRVHLKVLGVEFLCIVGYGLSPRKAANKSLSLTHVRNCRLTDLARTRGEGRVTSEWWRGRRIKTNCHRHVSFATWFSLSELESYLHNTTLQKLEKTFFGS